MQGLFSVLFRYGTCLSFLVRYHTEGNTMIRILMICHGNICRSIAAHYVLQNMVDEAGLSEKFYIDSAATSREELGNPVYPPMERTLKSHSVPIGTHRARQMTKQDYDDFDYLIAMDRENLYFMNRMYGETDKNDDRTAFWKYTYDDIKPSDPEGKISLLLDHVAGREGQEVADPWYTRDFEATYRDVTEGCSALLKELGF